MTQYLHLVSIGVLTVLLLHSYFMLKFITKLSEFLLKLETGHETIQRLHKSIISTLENQEKLHKQMVDIWATRPCLLGSMTLGTIRDELGCREITDGSQHDQDGGFDCLSRGLADIKNDSKVHVLSNITCWVGGLVQSPSSTRDERIRNSNSD